MPYIGKSPVGGGFHKLDNLTASATDTYALTLGSAAYYPETANQLLVSLNGVIQAPQDSFTVSGSNLVFDSALTASDSIDFVVALGDVLGVQGVTDGTVTTNKIANGAVTSAKLAAGVGGVAGISSSSTSGTAIGIDSTNRVTMPYQPAFFASGGGGSFNSSGIFVGDSSAVQKTNVGGHYSYSTGRFTAPIAGVYMFSYLLTTNDTASHMVNIHINGADNLQPVLNYYNDYDSATNVVIFTLAANDYVEAHLRASSGYGYYGARFCGHLIG
jgi:hypothetical protein